jgi:hypothetical protein
MKMPMHTRIVESNQVTIAQITKIAPKKKEESIQNESTSQKSINVLPELANSNHEICADLPKLLGNGIQNIADGVALVSKG